MKKIFILMILFVSMLGFNISCQGGGTASFVFLKFQDETQYKQLKSNEMASNLLLTYLIEIPEICLFENAVVDNSEFEERLNATPAALDKAASNSDFAYLFSASKVNINKSAEHDTLPADITKELKRRYNADYLIHGAVNNLSSGVLDKETLLPGMYRKIPFISADLTIRVVKTESGEIVWGRRVKASSKDVLYLIDKYKIYAGTGELSLKLFYEAMDKVCKTVAENLAGDIDSKKLIL